MSRCRCGWVHLRRVAGDGAAAVSEGIPRAKVRLGAEGGGGEAAPHRHEVGFNDDT